MNLYLGQGLTGFGGPVELINYYLISNGSNQKLIELLTIIFEK